MAPECSVCINVRMELGGHPDSKLDGENGLAAATMRELCRLTIEGPPGVGGRQSLQNARTSAIYVRDILNRLANAD